METLTLNALRKALTSPKVWMNTLPAHLSKFFSSILEECKKVGQLRRKRRMLVLEMEVRQEISHETKEGAEIALKVSRTDSGVVGVEESTQEVRLPLSQGLLSLVCSVQSYCLTWVQILQCWHELGKGEHVLLENIEEVLLRLVGLERGCLLRHQIWKFEVMDSFS